MDSLPVTVGGESPHYLTNGGFVYVLEMAPDGATYEPIGAPPMHSMDWVMAAALLIVVFWICFKDVLGLED